MKKYHLISTNERFWEEDGYIYFERNGKIDYSNPQTLATDYLDYRYTHGGNIYREACEIVWKKRR
ncbi:MAG: hypothetical protein DRG39_05655 [Deltaproteobacteria bacterium]|nr:MAG: hypothetical protein DRG39_05655 [Deltaproteobacteria bacterium]